MDQDLSQFFVVQENPNCLLLQRDDQLFIYKEFTVPKFLGFREPLSTEYLFNELERRKAIQGDGVLNVEKIVFSKTEEEEARCGLLFESYVKNFDEELSIRRGTDNYWSEEELFNTFQACLNALKTFHEHNYTHGAIGAQSIIFSQDGFVKIADHFVVSEDLRRNWVRDQDSLLEYGLWSPEILAQWDQEEGWSQNYETREADLWSIGLVFLESMVLQASFEIYFGSEEGNNTMNIDSDLLTQRLQNASNQYSPCLMGLIEILLSPDPKLRTWERIAEFSNQEIWQQRDSATEVIHSAEKLYERENQIIQQQVSIHPNNDSCNLPVFRGSANKSLGQPSQQEEIEENLDGQLTPLTTKNKLTEMLESCLQKSKELIQQNESRKKQIKQKGESSSYFTLNQQNNTASIINSSVHQMSCCDNGKENLQSKNEDNEKIDELFERSMLRSKLALERSNKTMTQSKCSEQENKVSSKQSEKGEPKQNNVNYDLPLKNSVVVSKTQSHEKMSSSTLKDIQNNPKDQRLHLTKTKIDYENNITYVGLVDKQNNLQPQTINNQQDMFKSGQGTLFSKEDGQILYKGEWKDDNFNGNGYLKNFSLDLSESSNQKFDPTNFSNLADIWKDYTGEFEDGLMNGKGQLKLANGSIFSGQFKQGSIEGYGMALDKNGNITIGLWSQNELIQVLGQ